MKGNDMSTHTELTIGSRVALAQDYQQLPGTIIPRNALGTVVETNCDINYPDGVVAVKLDHFPEGFDEWQGELWFSLKWEPAHEWLVVL
jgi:hypothetical protein